MVFEYCDDYSGVNCFDILVSDWEGKKNVVGEVPSSYKERASVR